jgi:hypothetical protein
MKSNKRETVEDYLIHLESKGIEIGYFEIYPIKDLHKSCCLNATTKVIDFDRTKIKLVATDHLVTPKSCDCLKIQPKKGCIDLIEMKGFAKFIDRFKGISAGEVINEQIQDWDLQKKIEDSLHILNTITLKKELRRNNNDVEFFRNTKINYIVLTDVDSIHESFNYIALNFIFYAEYSDSMENYIASEISKELTKIPNINHKLNSPMLKTCNEIDDYYLENR